MIHTATQTLSVCGTKLPGSFIRHSLSEHHTSIQIKEFLLCSNTVRKTLWNKTREIYIHKDLHAQSVNTTSAMHNNNVAGT